MTAASQIKSNFTGDMRRRKILEMIEEDGHVKVTDLSSIFRVSEVTIRQDLERLETGKLTQCVHVGKCADPVDMIDGVIKKLRLHFDSREEYLLEHSR